MASNIDIDDEDYIRPEIIQSFADRFSKATKNGAEMARHTKDSLDWFRKMVTKNMNYNRQRIIKGPGDYKVRKGRENRTLVGRLYYFEYDAKEAGDRELEVYDRFPMVFVFNTSMSNDGHKLIHAINMHYLLPRERAQVYLNLMKIRNKKGWTNATKLKASWALLKSVANHALLKRAVHTYRVDRVVSHKMVEIHAYDWEIAIFLQLAKWMKPGDGDADRKEVSKTHRARARQK
jgi:hypothetical protein